MIKLAKRVNFITSILKEAMEDQDDTILSDTDFERLMTDIEYSQKETGHSPFDPFDPEYMKPIEVDRAHTKDELMEKDREYTKNYRQYLRDNEELNSDDFNHWRINNNAEASIEDRIHAILQSINELKNVKLDEDYDEEDPEQEEGFVTFQDYLYNELEDLMFMKNPGDTWSFEYDIDSMEPKAGPKLPVADAANFLIDLNNLRKIANTLDSKDKPKLADKVDQLLFEIMRRL